MNKLVDIGLIIGTMLWWAKGKAEVIADNYMTSFKQLEYEIAGIKDVSWVGGLPFFGNKPVIRFLLDLKIINPSFTDFILAEQSTLRLNRLDFLDKDNNIIASSVANINSINLPAQSDTTIRDINVELPVAKIPGLITQLSDFNPDNLNMRVSLTIAGQEVVI